MRGPYDIETHLVFFRTFGELKLLATGPIDHATSKLFEQSPTPILYVGPCDLMLGRVPLFPLFLKGNAAPTIPYKLRHLKSSASAAAEGRRGSNVYEVNLWLWQTGRQWQFGCGRPHIGGLSVSETKERRDVGVRAGAKRSHETRCRREAARRGDE